MIGVDHHISRVDQQTRIAMLAQAAVSRPLRSFSSRGRDQSGTLVICATSHAFERASLGGGEFAVEVVSPQAVGPDLLREQSDAEACVGIVVEWRDDALAALLTLHAAARELDVPLLVVCGTALHDRIAALALGADAVVTRPLSAALLAAHVMAYARRRLAPDAAEQERNAAADLAAMDWDGAPGALEEDDDRAVQDDAARRASKWLRIGPILLDREERRAWAEGREALLTRTQFMLLWTLGQAAGTCLTRPDLLERVWDIEEDISTNRIDVHISALRKKLRRVSCRGVIQTVTGVGLRIATEQYPCAPGLFD